MKREPCPDCQSRGRDASGDNLHVYDDGHSHCHACGYNVQPKKRRKAEAPSGEDVSFKKKTPLPMIRGIIKALPHRAISKETCEKFNYQVAKDEQGNIVEIAPYYKGQELVAQKIRNVAVKDFHARGKIKDVDLFGMHLWQNSGKFVVITEGELDAMSVSEMQENKWPVVSVPHGSDHAARAIANNLEWLMGFDYVVLCFDNDEPGEKAAQEAAKKLPPGRARICRLPLKDANKMLTEGRGRELRDCIWNASVYRPDGILHVSQIIDSSDDVEVWEYPWSGFTDFMIGQRPGEIVMFTSGMGSGKSSIIREIVLGHIKDGRGVGMIMLEESPSETRKDIVSLLVESPIRRVAATKKLNELKARRGVVGAPIPNDYQQEDYDKAYEWLLTKPLYIYNHDGVQDSDSLATKIEYMATALGVQVVVLDHITLAVSDMLEDEGENPNLVIDNLMRDMRSIVERTGLHLIVVSQLRKTSGRQYEEGGRIGLQDLKGSGSLGQISNVVVAMERNRQDENEEAANTSILRVLKNRFTGQHGEACALRYDRNTGRMIEVTFGRDEDGELIFGDLLVEEKIEAPRDTPL